MPKFNDSDVDVIICWPKSMDYPLWRDFILNHKHYFNKIFIVFTETHAGIDYSAFVQGALDDKKQFVFIWPRPLISGEDWRSVAVNEALDLSTSNWVWFTEQDLFILAPSFWPIIRLRMQSHDVIGYKEGNRIHPANMWVKREFINKTKRDFGVVPDQMDHFGRFYFNLRHAGANVHFLKYQEQRENTFYHMNGLSHNLSLIQRGEDPVYKVDEFNDYIKMSLKVEPQDDRYQLMCGEYLRKLQYADTN